MDIDIDGGCDDAAHDEGLVDKHSGVRIEETVAFFGGGKEDGAHAGGHTSDDDDNGGFHEADGVVDGHSGCDGSAGCVNVEFYFFSGVGGLEIEELFGDPRS